METQVRTPQAIFMMPQRLVVPLFQRPYVWNLEKQWEPLWSDIARVAERYLARPGERHAPHFLGAVVLQQTPNPSGHMQTRTVIDGQQRLTTLQLFLDALHAELIGIGANQPASRIEQLVTNAEAFRSQPEDQFKVWPTNRDRPAFHEVMGASPPFEHSTLKHSGERMVEAHRYFSEQARNWLKAEDPAETQRRALAIETSVRELLQMVVIDLSYDENAQEIFETLNARGAQLTAADLIKNFIFQRLLDAGADVEKTYQLYWKDFETAFWETEIGFGRVLYPRSSVFLNHWLVASTGKEVLAREVFNEFKRYAAEGSQPMPLMLERIHTVSQQYKRFVPSEVSNVGPLDRHSLFIYRTGVLESEVIKPLLIELYDPQQSPIPSEQLSKALDVLESWMVRRALVRATTKNYNQVVLELLNRIRKGTRVEVGDTIESYLAGQRTDSAYWPDDDEVRSELMELQVYRRVRRGRLRMILEAIEDHLRGYKDGKEGLGAERVTRSKMAIEHVMPRKWIAHWGHPALPDTDESRDGLIHTIGNLTLLNGKLNSKVSNAPWPGASGKREALHGHDTLFLNRTLLDQAGEQWDDAKIRARTKLIADVILQIWPAPEGHKANFSHQRPAAIRKIGLVDLIAAGALTAGMSLFARGKKFEHNKITLLGDGRIDVDGTIFDSPSAAASALRGFPANGQRYLLVDAASKRSLKDVWTDYIESLDDDLEEDEGADDSGDDD
jgi:hypothetical protein